MTIHLNIELKSSDISKERIKKQLLQNKHYLKLLNKKMFLFTFISSTNDVYSLNDKGELASVGLAYFFDTWRTLEDKAVAIDLDEVFSPQNTLISPLNATDRFLNSEYILTENQENIKKDILHYIHSNSSNRFVGLTGGPGTGKTLEIYDLAKELAATCQVLIIHSGILCEGHRQLNDKLTNVKIISAKELQLAEINDVDIVIVDEAHRLYSSLLNKITTWVKRTKTTCIFSYDAGQTLSRSEQERDIACKIDAICENHVFKLTNKIRTNKELSLFITCLLDLSKYRTEYSFPNAQIIFKPNTAKAIVSAKELKQDGYTYISYTPSAYDDELDYQVDELNTHNVIGQEFDKVCMMLDDHFYYDGFDKLCATNHPNPDYIFTRLLYQGLTRVRSKIAIVVTSETLLQRILPLVQNN